MEDEKRTRYITLAVCFATWYSVILSRMFVPPLLPPINSEFRLTYTEAGFIVTALLMGYAIMLFTGGWLSGRMERRRIIVPGLALMSVASLLSGLSASYRQLVVFQFLTGLGAGSYLTPANALLSDIFPPSERGRAFSVHESAVSLGTLSANLIATPIAVVSGWRAPFFISAAVLPIVAILFWSLVGGRGRGGEPTKGFSASLVEAITPRFILMCVAYALGVGFCFNAFTSFPTTYLVEVFGVDLVYAAVLASVVSVSGTFGRISGGPISDHFERKRVSVALLAIVSASIFLLTKIPCWNISLIIVLATTGFALNSLIPIMFAYLADITPPSTRGVRFGFMTSMAVTAGALSGVGVGYLSDVAGFIVAFTFIAVLEAASILLLIKA